MGVNFDGGEALPALVPTFIRPQEDGGLLRVDLGTTGTANDRLTIHHEGNALGEVGISGNTVSYGGTEIGSFAGGTDGSDPLTVVFNADADVAAVEAVIQNITFENVSSDPSTTQRSARFSVTDGDGGDSGIVTRTIVINSLNAAPVLNGANDLTPIGEDAFNNGGTLVADLIAGQVTDADPAALQGIAVVGVDNTNGRWEFSIDGGTTWAAVGSPSANEALLLAADAQTYVRFVPDPNWNGTDTYQYKASDGQADSAPTTVTIVANPVEDPPVADPDAYAVDEDNTLYGTSVLANDTDADDPTGILGVAQVSHSTTGVDASGTIVFKQLGALTPEVIEQEILPRIGNQGSAAR